jgi:parallel beta-helix repeat protein
LLADSGEWAEEKPTVNTKALLAILFGLGLMLSPRMLLGRPSHAQAGGILYVAPGGDCGGQTPCFDDVQAAVDSAQPGDEIRVAAGTYTDVNHYGSLAQVVYISKTVTIRGGYAVTDWDTPDPVANPATLDAKGQGRVLFIIGDPSAKLRQAQSGRSGRAITPTIESLWLTGGNASGLGGGLMWNVCGGLCVINAMATIRGNQLFRNTADSGGGLHLEDSVAMLSNNTITSNTAFYGGGVKLFSSDATLVSNTISSNTAHHIPGGLEVYSSSSTLRNNTISSNTAEWHGGGLRLLDSDSRFSGNSVTLNSPGKQGGGLYLQWGSSTLSDNTIASNTAHEQGGGLALYASAATLSGNKIYPNTTQESGGGLYLSESGATLSSNTVSSNTAYSGGGCSWTTATLH